MCPILPFGIVGYVHLFWSTFLETAVYIIGTTVCVRVFGDSVFTHQKNLPGSVAGHFKDRHGFKNHTSNGFLHLEMVITNLPAYLFAIPDIFPLSESFTLITFKLNLYLGEMATSPSPGQVAKKKRSLLE